MAQIPEGAAPLQPDLFYQIELKNDGAPRYYLRIKTGLSNTELLPDRPRLTDLFVYAADKKSLVQHIKFGPVTLVNGTVPKDEDASDVLANDVDQGDFNFDGYLDVEGWIYAEGGSGGYPAVHYLFDPKKHQYAHNAQLDALWNSSFDDQQRIVKSFSRGGGMYSTSESYRWVGKKLVLISRVKRDHDTKGYYTEYSDFSHPSHPLVHRVYLNQ